MEDLTPAQLWEMEKPLGVERRLEVEKQLELLAKKNGQTPEERFKFLAKKEDRSPEEFGELIFRYLMHTAPLVEKMMAELQENLETSEDKVKTLEEFAAKYRMKRSNNPLPPGFA